MLEQIELIRETADLIYTEVEVEAALDAMASAINAQLTGSNLLVLCVLNGGIITAGKLMPKLTMLLTLDSINASRYKNQTSGGPIEWVLKPSTPLQNRNILLVDDILDEGITLAAIKEYCYAKGAKAVYCAVLGDKMLGRDKPIQADFVGLHMENRYLFGYGLDYKGYLRNAAGIYACKE